MRETMHNAQGIGLAAPQGGKSVALCIVEMEDEDQDDAIPFLAMANPRITWKGLRQVSMEEGCLSIPGLYGQVRRPQRIRVKYQDLTGAKQELEASGLFARVLQHEIDHLGGILFTSHTNKKKLQTREVKDYPRI
jgi:peptide deformylase